MKKAFTLSEVLIVLGIIGVVAALTLPSVIGAYERKIFATKLQKDYEQITLSAQQIINDENANEPIYDENGELRDNIKTGFYTSSAGNSEDGLQNFLSNYFKHNKVGKGLLTKSYKSPKGDVIGNVDASYDCIKTQASSVICMRYDENVERTIIAIDVNGNDDPNLTGIDFYVMQVLPDGSVADITDEDECNKYPKDNAGDDITGIENYAGGCLNKVINAGWKLQK